MRPIYGKIGCLGIIGVDKKQRSVKMRNLPIVNTKTLYINLTVFVISR